MDVEQSGPGFNPVALHTSKGRNHVLTNPARIGSSRVLAKPRCQFMEQAACGGKLDILEYLFLQTQKAKQEISIRLYALAAKSGHADAIALLHKLDCPPLVTAAESLENPLRTALWEGHVTAALKLIELGCEVDEFAFTAAMNPGRPELIRALAILGYDPEIIFTKPVARAVEMGRSDVLEALLETGAKIGTSDDLISLLTSAASQGNIAIVELLLKNASRPGLAEFRLRAVEVTGVAIAANRSGVAKILISKAHQAQLLDREARTDLMLRAIERQNCEILECLLAPTGDAVQ